MSDLQFKKKKKKVLLLFITLNSWSHVRFFNISLLFEISYFKEKEVCMVLIN